VTASSPSRVRAASGADLPFAGAGQRIGLFGGSFDPPHAGHVHVTTEALKRFRLDAVWWLVTPGNPLKARGPAPLPDRLAAARRAMRHPRVAVTGLEGVIGTRFTAETLGWLVRHRPRQRFVWLMGADNLAQVHLWDRWDWIFTQVPVGILARPGHRLPARTSPAAARFARARLPAAAAPLLAGRPAPAWCFVNMPMRAISSSDLRAAGAWRGGAGGGWGGPSGP